MKSIDPWKRLEAYIRNMEKALEEVGRKEVPENFKRVVEMAGLYLSDAKYYYEKKDLFTSLACIAYAEGLIDGLRHAGIIDIDWEPLSRLLERPKVLVAGGFEIIHPGHIYLFKEAWKLGRVYVVVARDTNFRKFKKREPIIPEDQRLRVVESIKYVHKAVLGDENDYVKPIEEIKPDVVLLGPDQWASEEKLREELEKRGLDKTTVKRLSRRIDEGLYSVSKIIRLILERHGCIDKEEATG